MKFITGLLGLGSCVGLAGIALGVVPWGVRAVAAFTLLGFVWLFLVVVQLSVYLYQRQ